MYVVLINGYYFLFILSISSMPFHHCVCLQQGDRNEDATPDATKASAKSDQSLLQSLNSKKRKSPAGRANLFAKKLFDELPENQKQPPSASWEPQKRTKTDPHNPLNPFVVKQVPPKRALFASFAELASKVCFMFS